MTMSDRIAVMSGGQIQQIGTPIEIYEQPRTRFVASFIGHTNLLDGTVAEVQADGLCYVDCQGIKLRCTAIDRFNVGQKVTMALRFEKIGIARDMEEAAVPAVVTDCTYMGTAVRIETKLANGVVMTADIADTEQGRRLRPGDQLKLT
jgi:ABC-type Fe3+/spermidine/putrescine transport system ATPase subunit